MTQYDVSIIIATYNTGKYIGECLNSIVNQSLRRLEVIIIDDGSTDDTHHIVNSFSEKGLDIKYYWKDNAGPGLARNDGIKVARGEFLFFMDPDDFLPQNDSLEVLLKAAIEHSAMMCGGNIISFDGTKYSVSYQAGEGDADHTINDKIYYKNYHFLYGHTRYLYSRQMIMDNQIEFLPYRRFEDQVFTIKSLCSAKYIFELDFPVYVYRINHKTQQYALSTWMDIARGSRDTIFELAVNDLELMWRKNAQALINSNYYNSIRHNFCSDEEFRKIWSDIIATVNFYDKSIDIENITDATIARIKAISDGIRQEVISLSGEQPIIIYGAGAYAKKFIGYFQDELKDKVLGVAISGVPDETEFMGYKIASIETYLKYRDEALVLITPQNIYLQEITDKLDSLGFSRKKWIDVKSLL